MKRLILIAIVVLMSSSVALAQDFCKGDFDYDADVDADDVTVFIENFGRDEYYLPCPADGPSPVPQTGQTASYATGDDGDLEKGVVWPNPRVTDNGDGTVTDNLTGLIWLKNANCFGLRTWNNALSDCNGLAGGSYGLTDGSQAGDWRLPNKRELFSLMHDDYYSPTIPNTAGTDQWSDGDPFDSISLSYYWTSTSFPQNPIDGAYNVDIRYGMIGWNSKGTERYIWPVRGGR